MPILSSLAGVLSDDPAIRMMQGSLLLLGILIVFLLLFATRDIILRTRSFVYQILSILLVAVLPGIGFLLYLLLRPARTIKEREMEARIKQIEEALLSGENNDIEFIEAKEDDMPDDEIVPPESPTPNSQSFVHSGEA